MDKKILFVDDDDLLRREFEDCFKEYGVRAVSSGEEALRVLRMPNEIDIVFLDLQMPGMSGLAALEMIRALDPAVKIVILTGHGTKDRVVEALRRHADDYIEKPFNVDSVRRMIGGYLGPRRRSDGGAAGVQDKIELVKDFIRRNSAKKVTLRDAAALIHTSGKYLSRVFMEQAGVGFNEYKLALKLDEAKKLLSASGCSVEQIAQRLGYENAESFTRLFKHQVQCTPTAYRKKKRKQYHLRQPA